MSEGLVVGVWYSKQHSYVVWSIFGLAQQAKLIKRRATCSKRSIILAAGWL